MPGEIVSLIIVSPVPAKYSWWLLVKIPFHNNIFQYIVSDKWVMYIFPTFILLLIDLFSRIKNHMCNNNFTLSFHNLNDYIDQRSKQLSERMVDWVLCHLVNSWDTNSMGPTNVPMPFEHPTNILNPTDIVSTYGNKYWHKMVQKTLFQNLLNVKKRDVR